MSIVKVTTTLPISWKEFEVGEWAHTFLSEKIVACIQIERIRSMYHWKDKINSEEEWRLSFTTNLESVSQIIKSIHATHPYDTPQIIWNAVNADRDYSNWIKEIIK